jgi:RNA polymerase sigma-70 factor (ECF subfamily)
MQPLRHSNTDDRWLSDGALVRRFQQGDLAALSALAQQWEQPILRIAYRVLGNLHAAEEVRQEVFVAILQSVNAGPAVDRFAAWVCRCTVNAALTALRRQRRDHSAVERLKDRRGTSTASAQPEQIVAARDEAEWLQAALAGLDAHQRVLLALRFDEGLTFRQIAEVLDRPPSTVCSQIKSAIAVLRTTLSATNRAGPIP